MAEIILEAKDVEFTYPDGTKALNKLNISVKRGEKVTILGANGAGKSTLFLHFNGILRPDRGKIKYACKEVTYKHAPLIELRKNVGIVFQDPDSQLFAASVLQEISFGPFNLGLTEEEVRLRVTQAMHKTEILDLQDKPTHMLSFGQKKRVSIADILAMEPKVIIFDEPTAWLDPRHAREFMQLLDKLNAEGKTIIISTHDVDLAYSWSDQIFIMQQGRVIGSGSPREIFSQKQLVYAVDLTLPWVVEMHHELVKKGWLSPDHPLPKTKEDFYSMIPENPLTIRNELLSMEEKANDSSFRRNNCSS